MGLVDPAVVAYRFPLSVGASWSPVESIDRPMTFTLRRSNSSLIFAR